MQRVTVSRIIDAPAESIREAMLDVGPFMCAAGFDDVTVEGETIRIENRVGIAGIELTLEVVEDPAATLAYEQREGIFAEMDTRYTLAEKHEGVEVTATTDFEIDVSLVGDLLDATVITRQRTKELRKQLAYLDERAT